MKPKTDAWVENHGDALFAYALSRVSDRSVAEDLVQETFLGALQVRDSFEERSSERTWLTGILKHKILDYYRRSHRGIAEKTEHTDDPDTLFDKAGRWRNSPENWGETPEDLLGRREFIDALRACIRALPDNQRAAFLAREIDGFSGEDICKKLAVTATNLWVMLYRARDRLRRCLTENWFAKLSPGA
ncbi:MAG: sigma-70 family RNA polymerase sigma factor [Chitinivibrionales bacterium]|nr:sigma-70 family RNA polymerase sigma factor [Chitinivibrionales bacterium]MBD3395740.1 sigma-70 family RNA polymerase sigma factor [Chitinivibrionales bacterium]